MEGDKSRHVSAVETAITILKTLQGREPAGVSELATSLDMSKANVHKHLATLHDHGFLARDDQEYRLGLRFFELGSGARNQSPLYQEGAPKIVDLAEISNQTATLMVPSGHAGIYIRSIDPDSTRKAGVMEGERRLLTETASGRAVLACYSETERGELLPEEVTNTLIGHLHEINEKGVAVTEVSRDDHLQEIAAPVTDEDGGPIGAIALILGDESERSEQVERNYRQLVKKTSNTLSKRMHLRHDAPNS